jgi:uncharacterized membrane protein
MATALGTPAGARYDASLSGDVGARRMRITSLDVVRGVAMILMAIDHVRVYSGLPPGGPTPGIFFTRWITHFVAPAFVFLAGTSAYLHGRSLGSTRALSRFLLTRGLWLVLLEMTVIRLAWTFNLDFGHYMLAGVIWMLGWCMILMAALVHLGPVANAVIGTAIIALHNVTDFFPAFTGALRESGANWLWKFLYLGGEVRLGHDGPPLLVLFVIVPWIGVMMTGYAFGRVMESTHSSIAERGVDSERRRAVALRLGVGLTVLFVVLRTLDVYGDPRPWHHAKFPAVLAFLGTTKYPASLSFLLMTLGPMFILLALAERWRGRIAEVVMTFGRVPMFYYLLHIPVIHLAACVVSLLREGHVDPWLFGNHPMAPPPVPPGYAWSLALLYVVFAVCVTALYVPCRWYARLKATRRSALFSYL